MVCDMEAKIPSVKALLGFSRLNRAWKYEANAVALVCNALFSITKLMLAQSRINTTLAPTKPQAKPL